MSFPGGSDGKDSSCNVGDLGSVPGLGRFPGEGNGYLLQYSGLEKSVDCIVHGIAKSRTWLSDFHFGWKKAHLCQRFLDSDPWLMPDSAFELHPGFRTPACLSTIQLWPWLVPICVVSLCSSSGFCTLMEKQSKMPSSVPLSHRWKDTHFQHYLVIKVKTKFSTGISLFSAVLLNSPCGFCSLSRILKLSTSTYWQVKSLLVEALVALIK